MDISARRPSVLINVPNNTLRILNHVLDAGLQCTKCLASLEDWCGSALFSSASQQPFTQKYSYLSGHKTLPDVKCLDPDRKSFSN